MIALTGTKLSFIPLLLFQTTESRSASHIGLMRQIYGFIGQGGFEWGVFRTLDLKLRQAALTRAVAWSEMRNFGRSSTVDRDLADALVQVSPEQGYDPMMVLRSSPDQVALHALRQARQLVTGQRAYASNIPLHKYDFLEWMGTVFLAYWVLPLLLLNAIYSLCYPVICLYRIPLASMGYLQTTFLAIYCGMVVAVLVLAPHTIRFGTVSILPLLDKINKRHLEDARLLYQSYVSRPVVYEWLCDEVTLPQDVAKLVMSYVPPYEMELMHKELGEFFSTRYSHCVRM
eukprot:TRINITY_DN5289_c0_g2_i2.p1 TRINITY_DN5289_c0_g2~~TRINITY_DN5289_c0_g2_i2.p1  ORF type:complete len:287 (-),score=16.38 TRINITY_DN5289_c0_g2_i2:70-930(-)